MSNKKPELVYFCVKCLTHFEDVEAAMDCLEKGHTVLVWIKGMMENDL